MAARRPNKKVKSKRRRMTYKPPTEADQGIRVPRNILLRPIRQPPMERIKED
jgi:hypothetical protein